MSPFGLVIYLSACAVCGLMGRRTVAGFIGHFLLAIVVTPVVGFLALAATRPRTVAFLKDRPVAGRPVTARTSGVRR